MNSKPDKRNQPENATFYHWVEFEKWADNHYIGTAEYDWDIWWDCWVAGHCAANGNSLLPTAIKHYAKKHR